MRAIRAIAGTAALVMALMGTSATGAMAAGGKAKGEITVQGQGTLSFHASEPDGGGFIYTPVTGPSITGKVTCYVQSGTTAGTFTGQITKTNQFVVFYLYNGATNTDDGFLYQGTRTNSQCAPLVVQDLSNQNVISGYIDLR